VELWARNPLEAEVFVKFNMTQGLISKSWRWLNSLFDRA
jgi:hypothetical protein